MLVITIIFASTLPSDLTTIKLLESADLRKEKVETTILKALNEIKL